MKKYTSQVLLTAAVAGIIGASVATASIAQADDGQCAGANACKGQSACKTAKNDCAGHNGCKGTGFTAAKDAKDCAAQATKNHTKAKFEASAPAAPAATAVAPKI